MRRTTSRSKENGGLALKLSKMGFKSTFDKLRIYTVQSIDALHEHGENVTTVKTYVNIAKVIKYINKNKNRNRKKFTWFYNKVSEDYYIELEEDKYLDLIYKY